MGAPSAPSITNVSSSNPSNCGVNDGTITVTATGGSGSLEYSIGGAYQPTGSFTGLSAGTYPVSVRNAGGSCVVTGQVVILENPSQPVIDAVVGTDPTDCGTVDGTITITASSPAGNVLQYSIDGGATFQLSNVFNGLVGGTFNGTITGSDDVGIVSWFLQSLVGAGIDATNFTFDTLTQAFSFDSSGLTAGTYIANIGASDGALNGFGSITFNLRDGSTGQIPEPSAILLFGLAAGLLVRTRKAK